MECLLKLTQELFVLVITLLLHFSFLLLVLNNFVYFIVLVYVLTQFLLLSPSNLSLCCSKLDSSLLYIYTWYPILPLVGTRYCGSTVAGISCYRAQRMFPGTDGEPTLCHTASDTYHFDRRYRESYLCTYVFFPAPPLKYQESMLPKSSSCLALSVTLIVLLLLLISTLFNITGVLGFWGFGDRKSTRLNSSH